MPTVLDFIVNESYMMNFWLKMQKREIHIFNLLYEKKEH